MGGIYSRDTRLKIVSKETMQQSDSVIILGAGASLDVSKNKVKQWYSHENPLVIACQHKYFLKPDYTIFRRPARFRRWQGRLPGVYIIDERIDPKTVKYPKKTMFLKYTSYHNSNEPESSLRFWGEGNFFIKDDSVPYDSPGWSGIFIASAYCCPKSILIAGIDGFFIKGNKVELRHAKCVDYGGVEHTGRRHTILSPTKRKRNKEEQEQRAKTILKALRYIMGDLKVNIYICKEAIFYGIRKSVLQEMGVNLL